MSNRRYIVPPSGGLDLFKAQRDLKDQLKADAESFTTSPQVETTEEAEQQTCLDLAATQATLPELRPGQYLVRVEYAIPSYDDLTNGKVLDDAPTSFQDIDAWNDGYFHAGQRHLLLTRQPCDLVFWLASFDQNISTQTAIGWGLGMDQRPATLLEAFAFIEANPWILEQDDRGFVVLGSYLLKAAVRHFAGFCYSDQDKTRFVWDVDDDGGWPENTRFLYVAIT